MWYTQEERSPAVWCGYTRQSVSFIDLLNRTCRLMGVSAPYLLQDSVYYIYMEYAV
ncbi:MULTISPECIES: hypothetical protein [unclassified Microcoleus]|uniref:hypothetical protein n=1 Tax=unclassified Microcoleus TaxID=2642155 RepID=UPI002FD717D4